MAAGPAGPLGATPDGSSGGGDPGVFSPAPTNLAAGLYLSTPQVAVDGAGGAPAPASLTFPPEWVGGQARQLRFAARLTTTGTVTWLPSGGTVYTTADDPDFLGSLLDIADNAQAFADIAGSGFTATGSPTASAYLALLAGQSDGTYLIPAEFSALGYAELVTGHAFFPTVDVPAGSTWLQVAVTLGATPPVITDGNGFTWETLVQEPMGTGYLTAWVAKITRDCGATGEDVTVSETLDSSIGVRLAGQTA